MDLSRLKPAHESKRKKRVGRGPGSGHGETSCRGNKGQKARSGGKIPRWFEGGQMPLQRRLPKRGFKKPFREIYSIVNLKDLIDKFSENSLVDPQKLLEVGLIKKSKKRVKILAEGEINYPLMVKAHRFSQAAVKKIEAAGGRVEVI